MDREYSRFVLLGLLCSAAALVTLFVASDSSTQSTLLQFDLAALQRLNHEHLTTAQMMAKASFIVILFPYGKHTYCHCNRIEAHHENGFGIVFL